MCVLNTWVTEITSLAVMDDGYDDTADRYTFGMLQTCKRHACVFKHSSRRFLCRCILYHPDARDYGNTLYILYGIHHLTRKKRGVQYTVFGFRRKYSLMMLRVIFGAKVKKLWEKMSDKEQWECFDWMCDNVSTEDETGDIDEFIVMWYKNERGDDELSDEGRCRRESRRIRFRQAK